MDSHVPGGVVNDLTDEDGFRTGGATTLRFGWCGRQWKEVRTFLRVTHQPPLRGALEHIAIAATSIRDAEPLQRISDVLAIESSQGGRL